MNKQVSTGETGKSVAFTKKMDWLKNAKDMDRMIRRCRMDLIDKLIDSEQINIVHREEGYVLFLSLPMYVSMEDDPKKANRWYYRLLRRIGLYEPGARFRAFLYRIVCYINFHRGLQDEPVYNEILYILVSSLDGDSILLNGIFNPENGRVKMSVTKFPG